jgi:multidrug transporter EmrE-like cation transporter
MDSPHGVILFLAILFGLSAVVSIRKARRKKERIYYVVAIVVFLMLSVFALALPNQPLLAFIVLIATGIVSAVALPKMMIVQRREMTEQLEK